MDYKHISEKCYITDDGVVRHKFARHSLPAGRSVSVIKKPTGHMILSLSVDGKVRSVSYARACWMLYMGCDIPENMEIDHKDRNPENNTKDNLRLADRSNQLCNQKRANKSGHTGVYKQKDGSFAVQVWKNSKTYWGGKFATLEEAIDRRTQMAKNLHGEFAV